MADWVTRSQFLGLSAAWGSVFLFIHLAIAGGFVPEVFVVLRLTIATAVALVAFTYYCIRHASFLASVRSRLSWPLALQFAALGLFNQALPYMTITYAAELIGSGLISLLIASQPFFLILLAVFFVRSEWEFVRLSKVRWIGLVAGFAGVALILVNQYEASGGGFGSQLLGVILIIAANLSFAIASLFAQKYVFPIEPLFVLVGQLFSAMCIMILVATVRDSWKAQSSKQPSATAVWSLMYCGFVASGIAFFLFFDLLRKLGSVRLNMINFVVPFFGVVLGIVAEGEFASVGAVYLICLIIGSMLILSGVMMISFRAEQAAGQDEVVGSDAEPKPQFVRLRAEEDSPDAL